MEQFRLATEKDLSKLLAIYHENHSESGGALVGAFQLKNTHVLEVDGSILGYVTAQTELPARIKNDTKFTCSSYQLPEKALYIQQVAVSKAHQNSGIGQACYKWFRQIYPDTPFFAFVHLENTQSMHFHVRNGFYPVGIYAVPLYHQTPNYTAFLLELKKH